MPTPNHTSEHIQRTDPHGLTDWLRQAAKQLGFAEISISQPKLDSARERYTQWIAEGQHGTMDYIARNLDQRFAPQTLVPNTLSIISLALPYLPTQELNQTTTNQTPPIHPAPTWQNQAWQQLHTPDQAYISRYAHGRDYHKVARQRIQRLAEQLTQHIHTLNQTLTPSQHIPTPTYRAFSDSAPVPEVEIAQQTSLGWRGKHTLLLSRQLGSMFFLGELYINLALPPSPAHTPHCGQCSACIDICPTQAITGPYQLDARRCISYLTIEHSGPIPKELRPQIGNRIYGCDDCQLICPWNKYAQTSPLPDFAPRHKLNASTLLELLAWNETEFLEKTAGSAIRRIGHPQWQRNILLALGNTLRTHPTQPTQNTPHTQEQPTQHHLQHLRAQIQAYTHHPNPTIAEQAHWSLQQTHARTPKREIKTLGCVGEVRGDSGMV